MTARIKHEPIDWLDTTAIDEHAQPKRLRHEDRWFDAEAVPDHEYDANGDPLDVLEFLALA